MTNPTEERAAIVAWLRAGGHMQRTGEQPQFTLWQRLDMARIAIFKPWAFPRASALINARLIERGDHLKG